jgi:hypothetical protein
MNPFVKYSFIAIGIQVVASAALVLATHGSGLLIVIDFYYPTIFLITKLGGFTGESTMMLPVFFGIPLGILLYGILFGLVVNSLKSLKK